MTNRATGTDERWRVAGLCLGLVVITFAVFGQTLGHEFIDFDDRTYVYENPEVRGGLTMQGVAWAFTHSRNANWHPLTWLSHMLDCQLYGLEPAGHHFTNVLLHAATAVALFLVLRQLTGFLWRSAFVAAVFAVHPLRVESVAWVAERKDVLSGLFFMLTLGAYARWVRSGRDFKSQISNLKFYWLAVFLFALGLMSKPMLVTLPVVLLLLDFWPLRRTETPAKLVMEKLPFFALSLASCVITLSVQTEAMSSTSSISVPLRITNAMNSVRVYLQQMIWPAGLAVYYPFPHKGFPLWQVAFAAGLMVGISRLAWGQRRVRPWLLTGWCWYLVMLLPVIGLVQVGGQAHADRYTYLPQIGIYLIVVWLAADLQLSRAICGGLMAATLAALMFAAWKQTGYWKTRNDLWSRTLACTTDNDVANNNFGYALYQQGRLDEAIAHYRETLRINPHFKDIQFNLGNALLQKGDVREAVTELQDALRMKPDRTDALVLLGNALRQSGDAPGGAAQYQKALQVDPEDVDAMNNLGIVLSQQGQNDQAIARFHQALKIDPDSADAHDNLGSVLLQQGKTDEAISEIQIALRLNPNDPQAHYNLGYAWSVKGNPADAIHEYERALQIKPINPEVENNLAMLLATCSEPSLRNGSRAVQLAGEVNRFSGDRNPIVLHTLAAALAETGRFDEAGKTLQRAIDFLGTNRPRLAEQFRQELQRVESHQPLHQ